MAELDEAPAAVTVGEATDGDGNLVVSLGGEIDVATVGAARTAIAEIMTRRASTVVAFDLSALQFMDSSGLAMLLTFAADLERIEVRSPSTIVRRVIEISGLAEILPMTPIITP